MNANDLGIALAHANELIQKQNQIIYKLQKQTSTDELSKAHTKGMHKYDEDIKDKAYFDKLKKNQKMVYITNPITKEKYAVSMEKHPYTEDVVKANKPKRGRPKLADRKHHESKKHSNFPSMEEIMSW